MFKARKIDNPADPFRETGPRLQAWHANVLAAEKAVADAERALTDAKDPASQTLAYRNLRSKQYALRQAYRTPA
jgi:hypothetical protein